MMAGERRSSWSDLPSELLERILQKLGVIDYLKCAQICRSWRRAVDDAKRNLRCAPAPQFPFLLFPPPHKEKDPATLLGLNPDHTLYTIPTTTWENCSDLIRIVDGWLMFHKFYRHRETAHSFFWFFNPVSGAKYMLQPLPLMFPRHVRSYEATPARSSAPDSPEFLVVIIASARHQGQFMQQVSFCNLTHNSWTFINTNADHGSHFNEFLVFGSKLYAINVHVPLSVTVFDLKDPNAITTESLVMVDPIPNPIPIPIQAGFEIEDGLQYITDEEIYMLAKDSTSGEVLLVICLKDQILDPKTKEFFLWPKEFRVFKLDMSGPEWTPLESLGDRFLLMDCTGITVVSTTNLNNSPAGSIGGDFVFFCISGTLESFVKHNVGVFSLKDKSIKRFSLNPSVQVTGRSFWFTPSLG